MGPALCFRMAAGRKLSYTGRLRGRWDRWLPLTGRDPVAAAIDRLLGDAEDLCAPMRRRAVRR